MSLRHVLLTVLNREPNSGYGIGLLLKQDLAHIWSARLQQIYSELAKLHADGLLAVETADFPNRPPKKIYSLTEAGKGELERWLQAGSEPRSTKDDLLVRLYAMDLVSRESLIRKLEQERDAQTAQASDLRLRLTNTPRTDPSSIGMLVTLEAARFRAESQIVWLERTLAWLRTVEDGADLPFTGDITPDL